MKKALTKIYILVITLTFIYGCYSVENSSDTEDNFFKYEIKIGDAGISYVYKTNDFKIENNMIIFHFENKKISTPLVRVLTITENEVKK